MSLYNVLFGVNEAAPALLRILGTNPDGVPRFRDCFLDAEKKRITIHTRTGGGNRPWYENAESWKDENPDSDEVPEGPWNDDLRKLPGFLFDRDDDFDSTYANFHYSFPKEYEADLMAACENKVTHTPSDKWQALFKALNENKP